MSSKLVGWLKKNGLGFFELAVRDTPLAIIPKLLGLLGFDSKDIVKNSKNEEDLVSRYSDELLKRLKENPASIEKLRELAVKEMELELEDTKSARDYSLKIADSEHASWLQKNVGEMLSLWSVLIFTFVIMKILWSSGGADKTDLILGYVSGFASSVMAKYHAGSSLLSSSKKKQKIK